MATGICKGTEEWDCTCITKNNVEGKTFYCPMLAAVAGLEPLTLG
jgi:hypothetical protein